MNNPTKLRFAITSFVLAAMFACGGNNVANVDADTSTFDAASSCDPNPPVCDFFLSCGCDTAAGEKCSLVNEAPACATSGAGVAGDTCIDDGDCEAGTLCINYSGELSCSTFCDPTHDCPTGGACFIRVNDTNGTQIAEVCGDTCSLLGQDCGIASQGCYPAGVVVPEMEQGICLSAGALNQDATCEFGGDCAAGLICVDPGDNNLICGELCDRSAPNCTAGSCLELIGHTRTGVCL